jgi:hypothetical protein
MDELTLVIGIHTLHQLIQTGQIQPIINNSFTIGIIPGRLLLRPVATVPVQIVLRFLRHADPLLGQPLGDIASFDGGSHEVGEEVGGAGEAGDA